VTTTDALRRRIARRETHSSRSGLATVLAVLVILACAYAGTEVVLAMLGLSPLLAAPSDMGSALVAATTLPRAWLVVGGVVVALLGLAVIVAALRSSRRPRHVLDSDRTVVVVDDRVIASALARRAANAADVDPDATVVTVGRRSAQVRLTPLSGLPVDREAVVSAVDDEIARYDARPGLRSRITIERSGKVGA
jgi:protein-S-isoprenylcysteine O-methyltransferase Ste14